MSIKNSIEKNKPLSNLTTLHVGGNAEYFVTVSDKDELFDAVSFAKDENLNIFILGGGSNVLIKDAGVPGLTIHVDIKGTTFDEQNGHVQLIAAAGEVLDDVIALCVEKELWGIENLSHIPGSIGAIPVQNVGAYGVETKDLVKSVDVLDTETMQFRTLSVDDCQFGYRDSVFKKPEGKRFVIVSVTLGLSSKPNPHVSYADLAKVFSEREPTLIEIRKAVIDIRSRKFPDWTQVGTAGSFFKNPIISGEQFLELKKKYPSLKGYKNEDGSVKVPLGWILDQVLHVKGLTVGNVGLYENQALVLINQGKATAEEIISFAQSIVQKVKNETDIDVVWEVTLVS